MTDIRSSRGRGFTLLELMVVMVIIGIIAAMATLSIGVASRDTGVEKEAQRIEDLLALVRDEAVLQGREFGLTFYGTAYEFSTYDYGEAQWAPVTGEELPFTRRPLPPGTEVDLYVEGRQVKLAERPPEVSQAEKKAEAKDGAKDGASKTHVARAKPVTMSDKNLPQVMILSSGDITPFEVRLRPGIGQRGINLRVAEDGSATRQKDEF